MDDNTPKEGVFFMEIVILAMALGLSQGHFNAENEEALRKMSSAYLEQSGIKDNLEYKFGIIKDKYINEDVQTYGGFAIQIGKMAIEQRVIYTWRF